jgi:hypothetical protein
MSTQSPPVKPVDYRHLVASFFRKHDDKLISQTSKMLGKYRGKEPKLCLILAKKYQTANPLNRVFASQVTEEHYDDFVKLTTLFLSVFYPQDVNEAETLCSKHVGNEGELFGKLSSNFNAINPLTMDRPDKAYACKIDYKAILVAFFLEHDAEQAREVEDILNKCVGKEAILFSVLATKHDTSNALNAVFRERMTIVQPKDNLSLLKLYLSVFHPSVLPDAKSMLEGHKGAESEFFSRLSTKFRACNPLDVCGDFGKGSSDSILENGRLSPVRSKPSPSADPKRDEANPSRSPAVTP